MSRRENFKVEQSKGEFDKRQAQYCSICTSESLTGTQYSTNLDMGDLHSYAINFVNRSLNLMSSV